MKEKNRSGLRKWCSSLRGIGGDEETTVGSVGILVGASRSRLEARTETSKLLKKRIGICKKVETLSGVK